MTVVRLAWILAASAIAAVAQNAQLSGSIEDPSGSPMAGAEINVRNDQTGGKRLVMSNDSGFYSVFSLNPGVYRISVRAAGFETAIRDGIKLDVGENARIDFSMRIGDSRTEVTVHAGTRLMNTEDASVGTVIDRSIIEQMPLNGRGIQSLVELTPGVVVVPVVDASRGQFAVNGQRADANYFTVDGVSANFGAGDPIDLANGQIFRQFSLGQAGGGMLPANNFLGTFANLVSPDALQEFKIQTSTFAPEFGRSPGAQISLITRSGTNRYSGSLFEYFRNDKTDAADWFANQQALPRPPLRFNNFGGTLGGPVRIPHVYNGRDRTFFFASVDELVMRQPQPTVSFLVPTAQTRQNASPLVASLMNAFPLPNRPPGPGGDSGFAPYAGNFSLRQNQESYGIRLDHTFTERLTSFVRYNRAPSRRLQVPSSSPTSNVQNYAIGTETLTFGLTHALSPNLVNDLRLNGSRQSAGVSISIHEGAGAKGPEDSLVFPGGDSSSDSAVFVLLNPTPGYSAGLVTRDHSRQLQFVDNLSYSRGTHQFKAGADYRWFSPVQIQPRSMTFIFILPSSTLDVVGLLPNESKVGYTMKAFSGYAQDTWRSRKGLSLTYGVRWEVNPAPRVSVGRAQVLAGITNFNDPSTASLVPTGQPFYPTSWTNLAPRLGIAWQILDGPTRKTVLRAGAGRFFDLAHAGFGDAGAFSPFSAYQLTPGDTIATGTRGPLVPGTDNTIVRAAAPGYNLPVTSQWNVTMEQSLGQQTLSAGYVGALGRRLIGYVRLPNPAPYAAVDVLGNNTSSSYNALQLQFNRRLSSRVRLLLSYTWSHSIDNLSSDLESINVTIQSLSQYFNPDINRGSSDFDIRHSLNGALMAALPSPASGIGAILLRNWSANSIFFARSALPTDVLSSNRISRPNLVGGQPLYLYGPTYPGGKRYNGAAFSDSPVNVQGNLGRNSLRGWGAWQIDFALHRVFKLSERASLQFRAEAFNILNHPNFANPSDAADPGHLTLRQGPSFGSSTAMLATGLGSVGVPGQLNPLFQIGGPRSMQFALRLNF